jgi:hypothetical protein
MNLLKSLGRRTLSGMLNPPRKDTEKISWQRISISKEGFGSEGTDQPLRQLKNLQSRGKR